MSTRDHHWIAVAGDLHGAVDRLRDLIRRFERASGERVRLVLQVGDLELAGPLPRGFPELVTIEGNHDEPIAADGVTSLGSAAVIERLGLRIAGLSGTFDPRVSDRAAPIEGSETASTRDAVARLLASGPVDVLLLHDWPLGVLEDRDRARLAPPPRDAARFGSPHGRLLVERLAPAWVFCGHHHVPYRRDWAVGDATVRVRCLADVPKGGIDAVTFVRASDRTLVESAPLDELEAFRSAGG